MLLHISLIGQEHLVAFPLRLYHIFHVAHLYLRSMGDTLAQTKALTHEGRLQEIHTTYSIH